MICQCQISISFNKWDDQRPIGGCLYFLTSGKHCHDCLPLLFSAHLRDYQPVNHSQPPGAAGGPGTILLLNGTSARLLYKLNISYFVIGVDNYKYVYEGSFTNIAQRQTTIIINYGTGCTLFTKFKGPTVTAETRHRSPWLLFLNYSLAFATPQAGWSGPQTTAHQLTVNSCSSH